MTVNLRNQLRELCAVVEEEQGPVTVDYVRSRSDAVIASRRPGLSPPAEIFFIDETRDESASLAAAVDREGSSREADANEDHGDDLMVDYFRRPDQGTASSKRMGWSGVVVVVATMILVVVGVAVVANGNSGVVVADPASAPSATGPVATPTVEEPVASPGVDDSVPSNEPSGVPDDQPDFRRGVMSGVTVGGPGLVAVGGLRNAAVWTSVDGITWSSVPHDEAVFGGAEMWDVTAGGPGLVAVGFSGSNSDPDAVVWTSVDGISWSRLPHDEAVFGSAWMNAVIVGGPGLVAVGSVDFDNDPSDRSDADAAVWTSVDGINWSRVPHDKAVFGGAENQDMMDVTIGGPGLVAVGSDGNNFWDYSHGQVAAVWTSVDGITWSRVPHDETTFGEADTIREDRDGGPAMLGVTSGGPGLVAVGSDWLDGGGAAVWISADGVTWSRVPYDEEALGPGEFMHSVTDTGRGLVAVGGSWGIGQGAAWTSVDGITWSRVPEDEAGPVAPAVPDSLAWDVITTGSGVVAVRNFSDAAVWTSVDGITWSNSPSRRGDR